MLLLTVVYSNKMDRIVDELNEIRELFELKDISLGLSESSVDNNYFIKVYCECEPSEDNIVNMFNLYFANSLYKMVVDKFYEEELDSLLEENYFFLKRNEIVRIKSVIRNALNAEGTILDESMVYCINRKNDIVEKIIECIKENDTINIEGFMTFRIKDFLEELNDIVERVVEKYMVEKEYNEFIKLLKYFVDIQESKIEEVNIIADAEGGYLVKDKSGKDVLDILMSDLSDTKFSGMVSMEDVIISGLISTAPKRVVIHCAENCNNEEFIDTIKNVFLDRVCFCEECSFCEEIKNTLKV